MGQTVRLWCALLVFGTGCGSPEQRYATTLERHARATPETPALFTSGGILLLSNAPNFGAQCQIQASGAQAPVQAALLHRGPQFLLSTIARKKRDARHQMTYLWNISQNSGSALNDALPGFAPIQGMQITQVETTRGGASGKINGHACREEAVVLTGADGTEARYRVWRADDLKGLPVRINSEGGGPRYTIDLTDIRLEDPAAALFEVPTDFTRYDSAKAMFDELFRRESYIRPKARDDLPKEDDAFHGQRTGRFRNY